MAWIVVIVALGLIMTALTLAELRQSTKTNALKLPDLTVGDRVIAMFALVAFALAFTNMLILVAVKTLQ